MENASDGNTDAQAGGGHSASEAGVSTGAVTGATTTAVVGRRRWDSAGISSSSLAGGGEAAAGAAGAAGAAEPRVEVGAGPAAELEAMRSAAMRHCVEVQAVQDELARAVAAARAAHVQSATFSSQLVATQQDLWVMAVEMDAKQEMLELLESQLDGINAALDS
ncbi:hypothetical protein FOA52_012382 [Chlamydomonas sp. UWO 241]|nr:hypothetical protein FOA52_012382 [Chlamydomonas sp. UWO 241]